MSSPAPPDPRSVEVEAWEAGYLVPFEEVQRLLGGSLGETTAREAVGLASTMVRAYCTALDPLRPVPLVIRAVALQLAARLARNPTALRGSSVEGQTVSYPPVGLTFFESILLNRYRRRAG